MASPQIEHGFVRIANEIWDEIIRRNFSKRQKDILLFIWRLSYGCRHKDAYIQKLKDFNICGVPVTHIKTELVYLESARVLLWDRENKLFSISKDYERWQISPGMGWDKDRFDELIHENLTRKTSQNMNFSEDENFTKDELLGDEKFTKREVESSQNVKSDFTKRELLDASNPCGSKAEDVSKDSIKDSIKDSSSNRDTLEHDLPPPETDFSFSKIYQAYEQNFIQGGRVTEFEIDELKILFDDYGGEWLLESMREAFRHGVRTLAYIHGILKGYKTRGGPDKENQSGLGAPPAKPQATNGRSVPDSNQTRENIDDIELARKRKEEFLKQRGLQEDGRLPNSS